MIADYQTDKAEHHQDSTSYHQPMRKLHPGEYLNQATSERSNLLRLIYPDLLDSPKPYGGDAYGSPYHPPAIVSLRSRYCRPFDVKVRGESITRGTG